MDWPRYLQHLPALHQVNHALPVISHHSVDTLEVAKMGVLFNHCLDCQLAVFPNHYNYIHLLPPARSMGYDCTRTLLRHNPAANPQQRVEHRNGLGHPFTALTNYMASQIAVERDIGPGGHFWDRYLVSL